VRMVHAQPGITVSAIALEFGISMTNADGELNALAKHGRIQKHGSRASVRWSAPGVSLTSGPVPRAKRAPVAGKPGAEQLVKGGTSSPARAEPKAAREPIFNADTIYTLDTKQRPTARWQMRQEAPDERWPSFAASRPGIDPATGKAWEGRA